MSDEALLPEKQDNLIATIYQEKTQFGLAVLDMTSGVFKLANYKMPPVYKRSYNVFNRLNYYIRKR